MKKSLIALFLLLGLVFCIRSFSTKKSPIEFKVMTTNYSSPRQSVNSGSPSTIEATQDSPPKRNPADEKSQILKDLENRYHTTLTVSESETGYPFSLLGIIQPEVLPNESSEVTLSRVISNVAEVLKIDHPEQLTTPKTESDSIGTVTKFFQEFGGLKVEGGYLEISQNQKGEIYLINNGFVPKVENIDVNPSYSFAGALTKIKEVAKSLDPQQLEPTVSQKDEKVIFSFRESGKVDAAWRINVRQPWLGPTKAMSNYYISIHDSDLYERVDFSRP